jgi:hypothetical protein
VSVYLATPEPSLVPFFPPRPLITRELGPSFLHPAILSSPQFAHHGRLTKQATRPCLARHQRAFAQVQDAPQTRQARGVVQRDQSSEASARHRGACVVVDRAASAAGAEEETARHAANGPADQTAVSGRSSSAAGQGCGQRGTYAGDEANPSQELISAFRACSERC